MIAYLFVAQIALMNALLVTQAKEYTSPLRDWQIGFFTGSPEYSPVGAFKNYSMLFRGNDGVSNPDSFLMVETVGDSFLGSAISKSYQQWTVYGTQLTYCGLLTFDEGKSYLMTFPQFVYYPQLSSEFEVYFCADPRGGGCDAFWWLWQYDRDTKQLVSNATVGGIPHELTYFDFYPEVNADDVPVEQLNRDSCSWLIGQQEPYRYEWMPQPNLVPNVTMLDTESRQHFKDHIPNYRQHYDQRMSYHHH